MLALGGVAGAGETLGARAGEVVVSRSCHLLLTH